MICTAEPQCTGLVCCSGWTTSALHWCQDRGETNELFDNPSVITSPPPQNTDQERGTHLDDANNARLFAVTVVEEGLLPKFHGSQEVPRLSGGNERL